MQDMLMARRQRLDRALINSLIYIRSGRVLSPAAAGTEREGPVRHGIKR